MSYSDIHRLFLQGAMNLGSMNTSVALQLLADIEIHFGAENSSIDEKRLRKIVGDINSKIYPLEQSLNFYNCDMIDEDDEYLVFVSSNHSEQIKLSSTYNDTECNFFIELLENLITEVEHHLTKIRAINLCSHSKVSRKRAEDLIEKWVQENYLLATSENISIGPRSIGEFGDTLYLKFTDDLVKCYLCKQLVFKGNECTQNCGCKMHTKCWNKFFIKAKNCPRCKLCVKPSQSGNSDPPKRKRSSANKK